MPDVPADAAARNRRTIILLFTNELRRHVPRPRPSSSILRFAGAEMLRLEGAALISSGLIASALYSINASWLAPPAHGRPILIAHRGVAQQYDRKGIRAGDCPAQWIREPLHPFLENTLPSIAEAFRLGADVVEVDVSPTRDGRVVLFHDETLECKTNGHGEIRSQRLADLKRLDVGYGYSADGGRTFPFRGKGVGMMPTLEETLIAFPGRRLLINFKGNDPAEADAVTAAFRRAGVPIDETYSFYGGGEAVLARIRRYSPRSWTFLARRCTLTYAAIGWSGIIPEACRNAALGIPLKYRWLMWGWPNRLAERAQRVGAKVIIWGDITTRGESIGVDRPDQMKFIPRGYPGYIWVEDIFAIARLSRARRNASAGI